MDTKTLLYVILCCVFISVSFSTNCNQERKCKTVRVHSLKTSDCYRMDLKEFPKCLPSNIEVVDLSYNRIRRVINQDLQRYPYIAHLYLTDNLIVHLDDDSFKDINYLETLDLSVNALGKVPPTIFQLPSLKTLYLSQNLNINIAESIEEAKPISQSSLTKLDMSYITEEGYATEFPDFKQFPLLAYLNISGDQFNYISTKHFAGLCNLQILASVNVTADFENDCDCWKINHWLTQRNVKFTALLCPISDRDCQDQPINHEDLKIFKECRTKFQEIEHKILMSKLQFWIGACAIFVLIVVALLGYKLWKRRQNKKKDQAAKALRERHELLKNSQV